MYPPRSMRDMTRRPSNSVISPSSSSTSTATATAVRSRTSKPKPASDLVALPSGQVEIASAVWGQAEPERTTMTVHDAIERLVYDFLGKTHDGWENNDGAYGDFTFDVAERTITLDYNERLHGVRIFPARVLRRRRWDIAITTRFPR